MKKTLSKSSNSNQLGTFFELYATCGCGVCGCSCATEYLYTYMIRNDSLSIESGYRNALAG